MKPGIDLYLPVKLNRPAGYFGLLALQDRLESLTHHADATLIEGKSYRVHESEKEAAARRKQNGSATTSNPKRMPM